MDKSPRLSVVLHVCRDFGLTIRPRPRFECDLAVVARHRIVDLPFERCVPSGDASKIWKCVSGDSFVAMELERRDGREEWKGPTYGRGD